VIQGRSVVVRAVCMWLENLTSDTGEECGSLGCMYMIKVPD
jgi:hypothetical protein